MLLRQYLFKYAFGCKHEINVNIHFSILEDINLEIFFYSMPEKSLKEPLEGSIKERY